MTIHAQPAEHHPADNSAAAADNRSKIVAAMSHTPLEHPHRLRVVIAGFLAAGVLGYVVVTYSGFDPSDSAVGLRPGVPWHFAALMTHIVTASVALALGPLQFVRRIRRIPRLHRYIGRGYLFAGVFPSSLVGIPVALLSTAGPIAAAGLLVGDLIWLVTGVQAYRLVRAHRYREHARWMVRNFALTFAAVTFRIWLPLLLVVQLPLLDRSYGGDFDPLFHTAYLITCWLAFIPNLLLVNRYLRRSRRPGGLRANRSSPH
ncbi:DUF2306 domain-containing protein [Nakamurella lactea]|uniref:DUF2306 domain-containing protein n=1 Tax=Nakamurella lactea TaxID=459515 RepID=UPI000402370E|nr:DUF2306 domain-containing protein [Nakamurella lactea]